MKDADQIKTLKDRVEHMLEMDPESRNSDVRLTLQIWKRFYPQFIHSNDRNQEFIEINSLFDLPREDNIKRVRAKIQNEEQKFLPTSWEVAQKRKINEDVWKEAMGYFTPPVTPQVSLF